MKKRIMWLPFALALLLPLATPARAQFSVLYNFGSHLGDPADPNSAGIIAQGRDGNLYSTTFGGGVGYGAVFKMTPAGKLTTLYRFTGGTDGGSPLGGLTLGTDGNFYGTSRDGGTSNRGTIFKITPGSSLTTLYNFTGGSDGQSPLAPPIEGLDGNFYGTAQSSPTLGGTVYKITPSGTFKTLYQFAGYALLMSPLVQGTDGDFYSTISGPSGNGAVFKITPAGQLKILHSFDGTHGADPVGPLVQGSDGNFYGTTVRGGTNNGGVVFKMTPTGAFKVLYYMNGSPVAGLVQASDGNFYGANFYGSDFCSGQCGNIFEITPTGIFSALFSFDKLDGANPAVTPIQHTNGVIYGDTSAGGTGKVKPCDPNTLSCGVFYSYAGLPAFVSLLPYSGKVGKTIGFLGQGFTSASAVSFNGITATFHVESDTFLTAVVPSGATTGVASVTTSGGTLNSNRPFRVTP